MIVIQKRNTVAKNASSPSKDLKIFRIIGKVFVGKKSIENIGIQLNFSY